MKLRKALSALAAALTLAAQLSPHVSADMLDGETTRSFQTLSGGAVRSEYVLGAASCYGVQEFSAVTFDCARTDLRFDVIPPTAAADGTQSPASCVNAFGRQETRHVIAALAIGDRSGEGGTSGGAQTAYGYTVYGGTMICSGSEGSSGYTSTSGRPGSAPDSAKSGTDTKVPVGGGSSGAGVPFGAGEPSGGTACSFGVAANGSAMIGEIGVGIEIRSRQSGETLLSGALNCFPQGERIALYTDTDMFPLPRGACALCVEVAPGYSLTPGAPIEGTVITMLGADSSHGADSAPNVTRDAPDGALPADDGARTAPGTPGTAHTASDRPDAVSGAANTAPWRVYIAARSENDLGALEVGDRITLTADISDKAGRTSLWRTVTYAVPGTALVRDGEKTDLTDAGPQSAAVIGLRPDGSAMMLASYGGQKGYSLGFTLSELADICLTLGMTDALVLGGGENVTLLCEGEDGALVPTGKSTGKDFGGALVISGGVTDITSGGETPGKTAAVAEYKDHSPAVLAAKSAGYSAALSDGSDLFRRMSAATLPHVPTPCAESAHLRAATFTSGTQDIEASICSLYRQLEFEATGEWLTLVIKESDLDAWYGKIFGLIF